MKTVKITISTKKGHDQVTTWGVEQTRPYPDLTCTHSLSWRNAGGLFPAYGQPATGIGTEYRAALLRSDVPPSDMHSRTAYAGYDDAPGAIVLRGQTLGEVTVNVSRWSTWKVRGYSDPTPSECAWLEANILPALQAFITANADALKADAVRDLREGVAETLRAARERLDKLEVEMVEAIDKA